jgi:hypothetical protein
MSVVSTIFTGKQIAIPKVIRDTMTRDEEVLYAVQQARLKQAIAPDSIFITNKRIIIHRPYTLGLRREMEDYKYEDMANTVIDQGIISSTIAIKMRFLSDDVVLESIPRNIAREIFKTIQDGIAGRLDFTTEPITSESLNKGKENLLLVLQERYIKGEITKRHYESMKKELSKF